MQFFRLESYDIMTCTFSAVKLNRFSLAAAADVELDEEEEEEGVLEVLVVVELVLDTGVEVVAGVAILHN